MKIKFQRLAHNQELALPSYESEWAAGMDVRAAVDEPLILDPGDWHLVPTGFKMAIPAGYEVQVRPRSGLAARHGITLLNTPGTIDADYRGEVKIIVINLGKEAFTINRGERIAQFVIAPVIQAEIEVVDELDRTARGEGGFGSTGKH